MHPVDVADLVATRCRSVLVALDLFLNEFDTDDEEKGREALEVAAEIAMNRIREARRDMQEMGAGLPSEADGPAHDLLVTEIGLHLAVIGTQHGIVGQTYISGPLRVEPAEWLDMVAWVPAAYHTLRAAAERIVDAAVAQPVGA